MFARSCRFYRRIEGKKLSLKHNVINHFGLGSNFIDHFDDIGDLLITVFNLLEDSVVTLTDLANGYTHLIYSLFFL